MNVGSGGEAVGSMVDVNHEMWETLLALPDMDGDSSAEWSEGPSAAAGGAGLKRRRTSDSDDADDGEDAAVSARLGARLSMNECIQRIKKRRAQCSHSPTFHVKFTNILRAILRV